MNNIQKIMTVLHQYKSMICVKTETEFFFFISILFLLFYAFITEGVLGWSELQQTTLARLRLRMLTSRLLY